MAATGLAFSLVEGIDLLSHTPAALTALTAGLWDHALQFREEKSAWTIPEVIAHMADGELVDWMPRVEIVLSDRADRRFVPFKREGGFARYKDWTLAGVIEDFDRLRRRNVDKLLALKLRPESLERTGEHPELGTVTLEQLLACWVTHDCAHLAQISRILTRYFGRSVGPWTAYFSLLR
jgi:hypothetical protein